MTTTRILCVALAAAWTATPAAAAVYSGTVATTTDVVVELVFTGLSPLSCGSTLCLTPDAWGWEVDFEVIGTFGSTAARERFGDPEVLGALGLYGVGPYGWGTSIELWADWTVDGELPGAAYVTESFFTFIPDRPFPANPDVNYWPVTLEAFTTWLDSAGGIEGEFLSPFGAGPLALHAVRASVETPAPGGKALLASALAVVPVLGRRRGS